MSRPRKEEGIYSATDVMNLLFAQNKRKPPAKSSTSGSYEACRSHISRVLSELNSAGTGSNWVTEETLGQILRNKQLNVYVLKKADGISEAEAVQIWEEGRKATETAYEDYVRFAKEGCRREDFSDVGAGGLTMLERDIDDEVRARKIDALIRHLYPDFDDDRYREDVKRMLKLDVLESAVTSNHALGGEMGGSSGISSIDEEDAERIERIGALEKKLSDLSNYSESAALNAKKERS